MNNISDKELQELAKSAMKNHFDEAVKEAIKNNPGMSEKQKEAFLKIRR